MCVISCNILLSQDPIDKYSLKKIVMSKDDNKKINVE